MDSDLELVQPEDRVAVIRLARESGRTVSDIAIELVHEARLAKGENGSTERTPGRTDPAYDVSRTELGRKLRALSQKFIESGGELLRADEICREVRERRGERE